MATEFTTHGFYQNTQWGGHEIMISEDGSMAKVRYTYYSTITNKMVVVGRPRWQEIKYDKNGNPFVVFRGTRLMLDNFLRTN